MIKINNLCETWMVKPSIIFSIETFNENDISESEINNYQFIKNNHYEEF